MKIWHLPSTYKPKLNFSSSNIISTKKVPSRQSPRTAVNHFLFNVVFEINLKLWKIPSVPNWKMIEYPQWKIGLKLKMLKFEVNFSNKSKTDKFKMIFSG